MTEAPPTVVVGTARADQLRWLLAMVVVELLVLVPLVLAATTYLRGARPLDYRPYALAVPGLVVLALMGFALNLGRESTKYGSNGVERTLSSLPWPDVRGIEVHRRGLWWRVRVARADGRGFWLDAPRCVAWRPTRRFLDQVEELRRYAREHGAVLDTPTRHRPLWNLLVALVLVMAGVTPAVIGWRYGVVLPWTPVVAGSPSCHFRVDDDARTLAVVSREPMPPPEGSGPPDTVVTCEVWLATDTAARGYTARGFVQITVYTGSLYWSPVAQARIAYNTIEQRQSVLSDRAEEIGSFVAQGRRHVVAQRANVIVDLWLVGEGFLPHTFEYEVGAVALLLARVTADRG
jgi:hypothetical protein